MQQTTSKFNFVHYFVGKEFGEDFAGLYCSSQVVAKCWGHLKASSFTYLVSKQTLLEEWEIH